MIPFNLTDESHVDSSFKPVMPDKINPMHSNLKKLEGSLNNTIPKIVVPIIPTPVQMA